MSSQNIESHIKVYWNVFYALLAFTVLTVAVSYIPFEEYTFLPFSPIFWILFVGLTIACVKGYLVSAYFMHLNDESSTIYYTLLLSVIFLFVLLSHHHFQQYYFYICTTHHQCRFDRRLKL